MSDDAMGHVQPPHRSCGISKVCQLDQVSKKRVAASDSVQLTQQRAQLPDNYHGVLVRRAVAAPFPGPNLETPPSRNYLCGHPLQRSCKETGRPPLYSSAERVIMFCQQVTPNLPRTCTMYIVVYTYSYYMYVHVPFVLCSTTLYNRYVHTS